MNISAAFNQDIKERQRKETNQLAPFFPSCYNVLLSEIKYF